MYPTNKVNAMETVLIINILCHLYFESAEAQEKLKIGIYLGSVRASLRMLTSEECNLSVVSLIIPLASNLSFVPRISSIAL